ncbi:hypothetical protein F4776DRAFT_298883 [Hypoxylon sp. NC0597]|nr:hypothetical protein F4776DRAFT_298883 [Hypoxylon sp. NC0597]
MRPTKLLRKALPLVKGFTFEPGLADVPDNVLLPLVTPRDRDAQIEVVQANLTGRVNLAFLVCISCEDVYRRVRGNSAFYHLILADWKSEHLAAPFPPDRIEELINLFVLARRYYLADPYSKEVKTQLTNCVDRFIKTIDDVDQTDAPRRPPSLKAPKYFNGSRVWPPAHFGPLDVATMAESQTRKELFGVDLYNEDEDDAPRYPHDQDPPQSVRKFLCHLSLTQTKPNSNIGLFCVPIAFNTNEQRRDWYVPTGHMSRFYATVDEFMTYAQAEFQRKDGSSKQHVIGLLTPWFFEIDAVKLKAAEKDEAIPTVWEKTCFRAGMMICLSKFSSDDSDWAYRVILFKPSRTDYIRAEEPSDRRPKQNEWIEELLKNLEGTFDIVEGWIGGRARTHVAALPNRGVSPDSVEVSCEIITEIMEDPRSLPNVKKELFARRFQTLRRYADK